MVLKTNSIGNFKQLLLFYRPKPKGLKNTLKTLKRLF